MTLTLSYFSGVGDESEEFKVGLVIKSQERDSHELIFWGGRGNVDTVRLRVLIDDAPNNTVNTVEGILQVFQNNGFASTPARE